MFSRLISVVLVILLMFFFACKTSDPSDKKADNSDIPSDPADVSIPPTTENNITPAAAFQLTSGNTSRIIMNLLGLINPTTGQPIELYADYSGGNFNFYLEEDGTLKGVKLTKVSTGNVLKADVVFTIDISGSMGQEADSIANGIIAFANFLTAAGLDLQFGSVGYYGYIAGALNLTTATELEDYLTRPYTYGIYRPRGFAGPDSAALETAAYTYASNLYSYNENGAVGILFADSLFNWRPGAQRVFVNFTDEETQPGGIYKWSTANVCNTLLGKATVHTVFSEDTTYFSWNDLWAERPWAMSECTGGTSIFINSYADSLNLSTLPVAGALSNSYKVEFLTASPTDSHNVVITVKVTGADGRLVWSGKYGE